jgi:hypothetical protein
MNRITDLFPGLAEHRIPTEGAEIFERTGRSGPPLLLYGQPHARVCSHKIEFDKADLTAGCRRCPTVVLWGSECLAAEPSPPKPGMPSARRCRAPRRGPDTPAVLIQAHAGSD